MIGKGSTTNVLQAEEARQLVAQSFEGLPLDEPTRAARVDVLQALRSE